ncbi:solute carrier family 23 member 3-like [Hypanus sabinus]|uniref:solute carrier family 23 member 3-like n=1 Tax=Hypanus sabinus TaxID=79690 RepID=UPI0028C3E70C|nr:solute carrier family 23 member 3-like [Hypanus sabinus]
MEDTQSSEQSPARKPVIARYPLHQQPPWIFSALFAVQAWVARLQCHRSSIQQTMYLLVHPQLLVWECTHLLTQAALLQIVHWLLIEALPANQRARQHGYQFMATSLFSTGVCTLLQTTLGNRLPLVQAPSFEYLIPAMILISHPMEASVTHYNGTDLVFSCPGTQCPETEFGLQTWRSALSEVRGAVVVSGIVQVLLGLSGIQGLFTQRCGPMVLAPMLSIIGLSCHKVAALFSSTHWGVSAL